MTDKELLTQLNKLKNIKPDQEWKKAHRDILLSQIASGQELPKTTFLTFVKNIFSVKRLEWATEPFGVFAIVLLLIAGGTTASVKVAKDSKPGDSLYIAKIISEKTQQAITFNEKQKTTLGIEFAGNRAKEISRVIAEQQVVQEQDEAKVEKLKDEFKKEISTAKTRLERMAVRKNNSGQEPVSAENSEGENMVFSADSGKEDRGLQISEINDTSTSTETTATIEVKVVDPKVTLEEAEKLFDENDFDGTLSKLEEANNIINSLPEENTVIEEVKPEDSQTENNVEQATSTN